MGPIAQPVEQRTFNPWVDGSIPSGPTLFESNVFDNTHLSYPIFYIIAICLNENGSRYSHIIYPGSLLENLSHIGLVLNLI